MPDRVSHLSGLTCHRGGISCGPVWHFVCCFSYQGGRYAITSDRVDLAYRRIAHMALQLGMGLLSKQRSRRGPFGAGFIGHTRKGLTAGGPRVCIAHRPVPVNEPLQRVGAEAPCWKRARGSTRPASSA